MRNGDPRKELIEKGTKVLEGVNIDEKLRSGGADAPENRASVGHLDEHCSSESSVKQRTNRKKEL